MANIVQMKDSANAVFYPQTHEKAVVDSNGVNLQTKLASITTPTYVTAWDGASTPVVANIPAGVSVTYNTTTYTGTLAASASTANKTYLVSTGTTDNYNRYVTQLNGSTYSWQNLGSTEIDLSDYATKAELNQLDQKVTGLDSYSFSANVGEHTRLTDMHPFAYVAGTTLKGRISLGTAEWNGTALAVYLTASDGTTVVRNVDISMDTEFSIVAGSDAAYVSFYIWKVTTAGTFNVRLEYGGMQKEITALQDAIDSLSDSVDAKLDAKQDEIDNVEGLVMSGFDNGAFNVGGDEISGSETLDNRLLLWNSGKPYELVDPAWKVKKYPVTPGTNYHIVGSTQYGNAIFSVINSEDTVLYKEKGPTSGAEIIDKIYKTPEGAAFIYVAYVTTIQTGVLTNVEIYPADEKKWIGKKWIAVGDSLTEVNSRATKNYLAYIAEATGISVVNMGLSGSGFMKYQNTDQAYYQRVANIATDADVITIMSSGNDLGQTLGDPTDTGTATICGCINETLDTILSVYMAAGKIPNIGVITTPPWENGMPSNPTGAMALYNAAVVECCERKSIPVFDLYHRSNLHPNNATFRTLAYSRDGGSGTHPDENGHKLIAPAIQSFLDSLI